VHVYTPADANRAAHALDDALRSFGRINVIIVGKHPTPTHPAETMDCERNDGLAVWPHLSDRGEPDLTLVCAGDLAASAVSDAAGVIRRRYGCRVRVVNVHNLSALASPGFRSCVGRNAPVIVATLGHAAAIWGLLAGRVGDAEVLGWREPAHPIPQDELVTYAGLDVAGITTTAAAVLARRAR
jgi:xylulose-5-phosphate/fructose-6-phosphate phosphoketolase